MNKKRLEFKIKIRRPDDWHVHLRHYSILRTVLPYTSRYFGRGMIMPNLTPPITTIDQAIAYRQYILNEIPTRHSFVPLINCCLTDSLDRETLIYGHREGIFTAARLYLTHATANSQNGVTNITKIYPLFEVMQKIGMPLLVHGEVIRPEIDIFDREAYFIEEIMIPIRYHFPELKILFEHISTKEAVDYLLDGDSYLGATITPQHLMFNRNHMLIGGMRPHLYCVPILKRKFHQKALQAAVASGFNRFFLGTDTAPHPIINKESKCICAGIFSAPVALQAYATIFEKIGAMSYFESFCSLNGPRFYNLPINEDYITLYRKNDSQPIITSQVHTDGDILVPFLLDQQLHWTVVDKKN